MPFRLIVIVFIHCDRWWLNPLILLVSLILCLIVIVTWKAPTSNHEWVTCLYSFLVCSAGCSKDHKTRLLLLFFKFCFVLNALLLIPCGNFLNPSWEYFLIAHGNFTSIHLYFPEVQASHLHNGRRVDMFLMVTVSSRVAPACHVAPPGGRLQSASCPMVLWADLEMKCLKYSWLPWYFKPRSPYFGKAAKATKAPLASPWEY